MSDYSELKRLAEDAPEGPWFGPEYAPNTGYIFDNCLGSLLHYESIDYEQEACLRYVAAANPAAVLELIAEIEALSKSYAEAWGKAMALQSECDEFVKDAERYRGMFSDTCCGKPVFDYNDKWIGETKEEVDRMIDERGHD